jgi:predicted nucleic acid-binding protein
MLNECERYLLDSCLLIYFADKTQYDKHERAANWIGREKGLFYVSSQSIREFANICLLKRILSPLDIIEFIDSFVSKFRIIQDDYLDTKTAVELCRGDQALYWDATIVSVMKRNGIDCILTEDTKDFEKLGVKAINPLK